MTAVAMVVCGMDVVVLQSYGNGMWEIASLTLYQTQTNYFLGCNSVV